MSAAKTGWFADNALSMRRATQHASSRRRALSLMEEEP
jgi:hypothetical protein